MNKGKDHGYSKREYALLFIAAMMDDNLTAEQKKRVIGWWNCDQKGGDEG